MQLFSTGMTRINPQHIYVSSVRMSAAVNSMHVTSKEDITAMLSVQYPAPDHTQGMAGGECDEWVSSLQTIQPLSLT